MLRNGARTKDSHIVNVNPPSDDVELALLVACGQSQPGGRHASRLLLAVELDLNLRKSSVLFDFDLTLFDLFEVAPYLDLLADMFRKVFREVRKLAGLLLGALG